MFDWQKVLLIARREIMTRLKQRTFRLTLIAQLIVGALAALAPIGLAMFTGDSSSQVVIVDQADSNAVERLAAIINNDDTGQADLKFVTADSADAAQKKVEDGDASAAAVITRDADNHLLFNVFTKGSGPMDTTAQRLQGGLYALSVEQEAQATGMSAEEAQTLLAPPAMTVSNPDNSSSSDASTPFAAYGGTGYGVAYIGLFLVYMSIIMLGQWVAQGVVEEKASRIMEIIVNAANPRDLLAGKILGILGAGLCMLIPMLAVSGTIFALQPRIADAVGVTLGPSLDINFAEVSVKAIAAFFVYFLFGFLLFGGLYAGIGSLVSRQEEVSQAISPVMTLIILGFFSGFIALAVPNTTVVKVLMYIPITSPFVALPRIILGQPGWSEILISVAILIVAAIAALWFSGRLYRVGVLMYGQKPSWKSLLKISRMQTVAR